MQTEADLAVALFLALREELLTAVKKNLLKKPVSCWGDHSLPGASDVHQADTRLSAWA